MGSSEETGSDEVLSPQARERYVEVLKGEGRIPLAQVACDPHLTELMQLRLLERDFDQPDWCVAVDPQQAAMSVSAALHTDAVSLLRRAASLPEALRDIAQAYRAVQPPEASGEVVQRIIGAVRINQALDGLLDDCNDLVTVQPGGARNGRVLERVIERDLAVLRRGGSLRTLYQPTARYDANTRDYVRRITAAGGQVRTLDEPFDRLIVTDGHTAVIPVGDTSQAAFIRDTAVISYLLRAFERQWSRALPFSGERDVPVEVTEGLQQSVLRLLLAGESQDKIARTLGVSKRTLARHIADIREAYGVETLFQLGAAVASGREQERPEAG